MDQHHEEHIPKRDDEFEKLKQDAFEKLKQSLRSSLLENKEDIESFIDFDTFYEIAIQTITEQLNRLNK